MVGTRHSQPRDDVAEQEFGADPAQEVRQRSVRRRAAFGLERTTESLGVRYFVGESFEIRHSTAEELREVEAKVENEHLNLLRRRCNAERNSKQRMVDAANANDGNERARMFAAADAVEMRWCEEKERLEAAAR